MHILPMLIPTRRTGLGAAFRLGCVAATVAHGASYYVPFARSVSNQYFSKNSDDTSDM
jgi:hypothetical protein